MNPALLAYLIVWCFIPILHVGSQHERAGLFDGLMQGMNLQGMQNLLSLGSMMTRLPLPHMKVAGEFGFGSPRMHVSPRATTLNKRDSQEEEEQETDEEEDMDEDESEEEAEEAEAEENEGGTAPRAKNHTLQGPPVYLEEELQPIECRGFTCPFQKSCGGAPLNPLTRKRKGKTPYIVHGEPEIYGEWPQYVKISVPEMRSICGGVLITDRHVLTVAHCTFMHNVTVDPKKMRISIGDHSRFRRDRYEVQLKVSTYCRASRYKNTVRGTTYFDYAVMTLERPVKFLSHVQPACLPYNSIEKSLQKATTRCYVMGLGLMSRQRAATVVQKLRVKRSLCKGWGIRNTDRSRHCFVTTRRRGDSCSGDSGGPVMCLVDKKWTVVGLVSYGTTYCNGTAPAGWVAVYTRVRSLLTMMQKECQI